VNPAAAESLKLLMEGNARFRNGQSSHYYYPPDVIREIGNGQAPVAAVIACVDGRVAPEILFDQPLGALFVSRVPGATAADSARWMLELSVQGLHVPLVVVLGHTECLAVGQIIRNESGPGGGLRMDIARAVHTARSKNPPDLFRQSVIETTLQSAETLRSESYAVRRALEAGTIDIISALYDVHTGVVELLDVKASAYVR
jgi:carbonic anhydrase